MWKLAAIAGLTLFTACEASRPPRSSALPPPRATGPSEPAPVPSAAAMEYDAAQRARRHGAPSGPDAMPGFDPAQRVGTDMITAPIPADRIRPPQR
jgi:hypothetical protein